MDQGSDFECEFRARRIRVQGTSHTNRFTVASHGRDLIGVHLVGVHLVGVYLIGVDLIGTHLTGVHLIGVHLTDMYLIGVYGPASQGMHLMGVGLTGMYLYLIPCTSNTSCSLGGLWTAMHPIRGLAPKL
jgi:hypothetical protein